MKIRKAHRYLGIFLGIQFLMWTISGIYFSWTDIDEIHGDHFRNQNKQVAGFNDLLAPERAGFSEKIHSMELKEISGEPYFWVNNKVLVHGRTGETKESITAEEALAVAEKEMKPGLEVISVEKITHTGDHHEYRGKPLPAWVISYKGDENIRSYVSVSNGQFETLRYRDWRWFDFLWMTHTMDYQTRDDFNTTVLRAFSLLGLITVLSGFVLWFISSPTVRKFKLKR